jgi:hypothetical protein
MELGAPRDESVPYKREIIGEFTLKAPAVRKGRDGVDYQIPAGTHSIVGAVSLDGYKLHDAAIVYDTGKVSQETGKAIFLAEPLHVPQLEEARKAGLARVHEPHEHKLAEALIRAASMSKKQAPKMAMNR